MTVQALLGAIMIGLLGLIVISVILLMALDEREWPHWFVLVTFLLLVATMFAGIICKHLGLLNAMI